MKSPFNDSPFANSTERRTRIQELRSLVNQEHRLNNPVQCAYCGQTIPLEKRLDAKYCSASCRVDASATAGALLNAATWQAAQQRAARAEMTAIRFRARADFLYRQIFGQPAPASVDTPKPVVAESKPAPAPQTVDENALLDFSGVSVPAGPPKLWKPSPAQFTGKLSLSDLDEMTTDEIPYACEYDANPSVRAFAPLLRSALKSDTDITPIVDSLRDYLRNIDDSDESEDTFESDRLAAESASQTPAE